MKVLGLLFLKLYEKVPSLVGADVVTNIKIDCATQATENAFKHILASLPKSGGGEFGKYYSLVALNDPRIDKLPYSVRILLESEIHNCDNF
jgi:hypothetical protein